MTEPIYKNYAPPIVTDALEVEIIDGEIVLLTAACPSLTPQAARETGTRLIEAADLAEASFPAAAA